MCAVYRAGSRTLAAKSRNKSRRGNAAPGINRPTRYVSPVTSLPTLDLFAEILWRVRSRPMRLSDRKVSLGDMDRSLAYASGKVSGRSVRWVS